MITAYTPGQYTTPAALTLQPPANGVLWGVWVRGRAMAQMLAEDLIQYGAHFGLERWEDDDRALVVVFVELPASTELLRICQRYAQPTTHAAALDVTGVWEEYRP